MRGWHEALHEGVLALDNAITTRRLRGLHVAITLPDSAVASGAACPPALPAMIDAMGSGSDEVRWCIKR